VYDMADPPDRLRTVFRLSVIFAVLAAAPLILTRFSGAPIVAGSAGDYWHVCAGRGVSGAAEYRTRTGTHPIVVFDAARFGNDSWVGSEVTFAGLDRDPWSPAPQEVQLVACAERVATGGQVTSCTIDPERELHRRILPLRSATIEVVVREARAGTPVGEPVRVENATACPLKVKRGKSEPREVFGGLTDQQYTDVLRPFAEG
jgi:hypothetical protein